MQAKAGDLIKNIKKDLVEVKSNNLPVDKQTFYKLFKWHALQLMDAKPNPSKYIENKQIRTILWYFFGVPDFDRFSLVTNIPSLGKGWLIIGDNGVGKSMLFEILSNMGNELQEKINYPWMKFKSISSIDFVQRFMLSADSKRKALKEFNLESFYTPPLYIDDLGWEDKAFQRTELMGQLLFERHRRNSKTFVTTNKSLQELTIRYGDHVGDRLPEMFNIIYWKGDSYRTK